MLTLLLGKDAKSFRISHQEMIKGVRLGGVGKTLAYFNTLEVPIIENTAREEDLTDSMGKAMEEYPDAAAILVRRHGVYVWGEFRYACSCRRESGVTACSWALLRKLTRDETKLTDRPVVGVRQDPGRVPRLPVRDRRQDAPGRHPARGRRLESSLPQRAPLEHIMICISHSISLCVRSHYSRSHYFQARHACRWLGLSAGGGHQSARRTDSRADGTLFAAVDMDPGTGDV